MTRAMVDAIVEALASSAVVLGPVAMWAAMRKRRALLRGVGLVALLFVVDVALVYAPTVLGASGLVWAWSGKALEVTFFVSVAWLGSPPTFDRDMLRSPPRLSWVAVAAAVGLVLLVLPAWLTPSAPSPAARPSVVVYQAIMPGLAEEVVYRGVLLSILDSCTSQGVRVLGAPLGLGAIVTTLLFWLAHSLTVSPDLCIHVDGSAMVDMCTFSLAMCWLRYRSGSVWVPAVAHNVHNCALVLAGL